MGSITYIFNQNHHIEPLITFSFKNQGKYHSPAYFATNLFENDLFVTSFVKIILR